MHHDISKQRCKFDKSLRATKFFLDLKIRQWAWEQNYTTIWRNCAADNVSETIEFSKFVCQVWHSLNQKQNG